MQCDCHATSGISAKTLAIAVPDQELLEVIALHDRVAGSVQAGLNARAAAGASADARKRERAADKAATWERLPGRCSECGGHPRRVGLLRCMACDAEFHRACADVRPATSSAVTLCPSCWDAQ